MSGGKLVSVLCILLISTVSAAAADKLRFWNLTAGTIVELYLAPAGTDHWGLNQCDNDPDKAVDADERLDLAGVAAGRYDAKLVDKAGRHCVVRNIDLKGDGRYAFSISEDDLKQCTK